MWTNRKTSDTLTTTDSEKYKMRGKVLCNREWKLNKNSAKILLATVFFARGTSFLFSKNLLNSMTPFGILALRFSLAFIILTIIFYKKLRHISKESMRGGLLLGVLYSICMTFEMYALKQLDSGVSSLIENMAIVLVPIYSAILMRKMPKVKTMFCTAVALIGVACLCITQQQGKNSIIGLVLISCAAMTYAACILMTEKVTQNADPIAVGVVQMGTMGITSLIFSLLTGSFSAPKTGQEWGMLLILVLVCSCFGFTFQPVGQKYLSADTAAVFTVVNPLTASVLGILVAGESMSVMKGIGYVLILSVLIIYNVNMQGKNHKED